LLLVSETVERILYQYDCFTNVSAQALDKVERKITELLRAAREPVPIERILDTAAGELPLPASDHRRFLTMLLNHHPQISGTAGPCYFLTPVGAPQVITAILRAQHGPMHYRDITRRYNEQMLPHSRRGTGYILRVVSMTPGIHRRARAEYEIQSR
jgi:hypothetical protein